MMRVSLGVRFVCGVNVDVYPEMKADKEREKKMNRYTERER